MTSNCTGASERARLGASDSAVQTSNGGGGPAPPPPLPPPPPPPPPRHSAMRRRGGRLMAACRVSCQRGFQMPFKREGGRQAGRRRFSLAAAAAAAACEMKGLKGNTTVLFWGKSKPSFVEAGSIESTYIHVIRRQIQQEPAFGYWLFG